MSEKDEKQFTATDLENAMRGVLLERDKLSENIVEQLREKGLLAEPKEPGTFKKLITGIVRKGTKHIDNIVAEGEEELVRQGMLSAKDKAKKRDMEAFQKLMEEKYGK